jgi:hypothetical protein
LPKLTWPKRTLATIEGADATFGSLRPSDKVRETLSNVAETACGELAVAQMVIKDEA